MATVDLPFSIAKDVHDAQSQIGEPDVQWSLVPLDSHIDDQPVSMVSAADRQRTADLIMRSSAEHLLLATHHPMVAVNSPWLDKDRIIQPEELLSWFAARSTAKYQLNRSPGERSATTASPHAKTNVDDNMAEPDAAIQRSDETLRLRGVVFGHAHQEVEAQVAAIPVWGVPSTCFQFQPLTQNFAVDVTAPGYRWLRLEDDGRIETTVSACAFVQNRIGYARLPSLNMLV